MTTETLSFSPAAGADFLLAMMGTPNPHTGDWSVGVSKQRFEDGEIAYRVSEITIAGCLPDLNPNLLWGSDLEIRNAADAPSPLMPEMASGGSWHSTVRPFPGNAIRP